LIRRAEQRVIPPSNLFAQEEKVVYVWFNVLLREVDIECVTQLALAQSQYSIQ
jgi:hypothetical protein